VEKYQFTMLTWLTLSDREASTASRWYQGSGWYYNPLDETGKKLDGKCVANAESADNSLGEFDALNRCGADA
jgi:hypothetical protein